MDLILGTAGHIDHGKTALIGALTGTDTDRLPEERERGITIDLGFAALPLAGVRMGVVDVPGHEGFIRNMLAGATGMDVLLLVVAADEGVMPQTREHTLVAELLGVRTAVVALTKTDLVEDEWLALARDDVATYLAGTAFARAPILPVSAVTGAGLDELRVALTDAARGARSRPREDLFRMPVDRVFTVRGTGTVLTGTVWSGSLGTGDTVRLLPSGHEARVRGLQVHGSDAEAVAAGLRAAVALAGVERETVRRGDVLVTDAAWRAASMLTVRVRLSGASNRPLRQRQRVRFHLGTAEIMARVVLLEGDALEPGGEAWAQVRLEAPTVARAGDRFVLRSYSPVTTIGGGVVVEPAAPKRTRLTRAARAQLSAVLDGSAEDAADAAVGLAGAAGLPVRELPLRIPVPASRAVDAAHALTGSGSALAVEDRLFDTAWPERVRAALLEAVDRWHAGSPLEPGMDRELLRQSAPAGTPAALTEHVLNGLAGAGELVVEGSLVARAGWTPALTDDQHRLKERLITELEAAGLAPPAADALAGGAGSERVLPLLRLLERGGRIVQVAPDMYVAARALQEAAERVRRELAGREALGPADFRPVLGVSRRFLIPLLEHFDASGVTVRRGDQRRVPAARQSPTK